MLDKAPIPGAARRSDTFDSDLLRQPFEMVGTPGLVDAYRLYKVDEQPDAVQAFVVGHLPAGASLSGTGGLGDQQGSAQGFEVSMPTSGPNENYAKLVYTIVADAVNSSEFRVDAQVIWLPNRSAGELSPSGGVVEVTGFGKVTLVNGSSDPVTVSLSGAQADSLRAAADSLPLAPPPACMEDSLLYRVVFRPSAGTNVSFELDGMQCGATVLVVRNGQALSPISDARCLLLRTVVGVLPAGEAIGTASSLSSCSG